MLLLQRLDLGDTTSLIWENNPHTIPDHGKACCVAQGAPASNLGETLERTISILHPLCALPMMSTQSESLRTAWESILQLT